MDLTSAEESYLRSLRHRLESLKRHLDAREMPDSEAPARDWCNYLSVMKEIVGNVNNDLSFVAALMAKDYLYRTLRMKPFDVAAKAQGAPGLDIDEMTLDNKRVIGEIKTTTPYLGHDLGSAQRTSFQKDFAKLNATTAEYKFLSVLDEQTFRLMTQKYATQLPGVTIVLLTTEEAHAVPANAERTTG